jgi:hypothetical protein
MWSCPRSRSSVVTRAFEQLDECEIFVLPLYGAYIFKRPDANDVPDKELIMNDWGTDPQKVIQKITGELPEGKAFSFQKDNPLHVLPEFGTSWLKKLSNFFLLRDPREIILSYQKAMNGELPYYGVGIKELYQLFKTVEAVTGETPLVIHSDDVVKNPLNALQSLCTYLGIEFNLKMLSWQSGLQDSKFLKLVEYSSAHEPWFSTVLNSQHFLPYQEKKIDFPDNLMPILEECLPYYEKILQHRVSLLKD